MQHCTESNPIIVSSISAAAPARRRCASQRTSGAHQRDGDRTRTKPLICRLIPVRRRTNSVRTTTQHRRDAERGEHPSPRQRHITSAVIRTTGKPAHQTHEHFPASRCQSMLSQAFRAAPASAVSPRPSSAGNPAGAAIAIAHAAVERLPRRSDAQSAQASRAGTLRRNQKS